MVHPDTSRYEPQKADSRGARGKSPGRLMVAETTRDELTKQICRRCAEGIGLQVRLAPVVAQATPRAVRQAQTEAKDINQHKLSRRYAPSTRSSAYAEVGQVESPLCLRLRLR